MNIPKSAVGIAAILAAMVPPVISHGFASMSVAIENGGVNSGGVTVRYMSHSFYGDFMRTMSPALWVYFIAMAALGLAILVSGLREADPESDTESESGQAQN